MKTNEFTQFNFREGIFKALSEAGFKTPSPVQKEAIPFILSGSDVVAQAHTGTGKTAAFGLPILNMMNEQKAQTLVITPTRELCVQVSDELYRLGKYEGIKTASIYGGQSYQRQIKQANNAHVLVATPGRLLDLLKSEKISINPKFVILDEADEMLDMGFLDDIKKILTFVPKNSQKLLFSATMPIPIRKIAEKFLKDPKYVQITAEVATNKDILQEYYVVEEKERTDATVRLIDFYDPKKAIIFCRMKREADVLSNTLLSKGYGAKALHGDMDQREREITIKAFKDDTVEILVATDVAARGLDIGGVSHVFNYHIPFDSQSYVHRIGRTGRAGNKGIAITLVSPLEFKDLQRIKKSVGSLMEHKFIPSMQDLSDDMDKKLLQKINDQKINARANKFLSLLEENMEISQVALRAISLLIDGQKISGPDKIGLDAKNIKKVLDKFKNEKGRSSNKRRRIRRDNRSRR